MGGEGVEQGADAGGDVVADGFDALGRGEGRVSDRPVLVADAGDDRAHVAAAHGDDDIGGADRLVGKRLGEPLGGGVLALDLGE